MRVCEATRKDGLPCQAPALPGERLCFWHHPDKARDRAEARRKGGLNRRQGTVDPSFAARMRDRAFRTLEDMEALLELVIKQTLQLENSVSRNRCLGYLVGQWCKVHEVGELEQRLEALEQRIGR